mgnify:CR=1 FL=1
MEWRCGIDTVAHRATLESKWYTIAVLGNGFNNIFPPENIPLYHEIINKKGLVLSEYPPEEKAKSKNFLERNRIVSGLSKGILIIEAMYRSGTSVTARLAKEQGRKVFVLPHEIDDKNGVGTNRLIREGAILVTSVKDIISEFSEIKYKEIKRQKQKESKIQKNEILNNNKLNTQEKLKKVKQKQDKLTYKEKRENITSKTIMNKTKKILSKKTCNNEEFDEIYKFINEIPITVEELTVKTNKQINEIYNILFMLEIEEYIEKVEGGYICKS